MMDNRAQVDEIDKKDYQKFLMGGTEEKHACAKVAWTTLIKEKSKDGVGLLKISSCKRRPC